MKLKAVVEYKGSRYFGYQKQDNALTIQEEIEKVISKILNVKTSIYASGRTDAGVHAKGQVFHFEVNKEVDLDKFRYSLNCVLPNDIHIISLEEVSDDFHARFSAKSKEYQYIIKVNENDPFSNELTYNYLRNLDKSKLEYILTKFNGKKNFQNFTSKEEDEDGFIREVKIDVTYDKDLIIIHFVGNGFMRYMIRYIVGCSLAFCEGKISEDVIDKRLTDFSSREIVPFKAPPQGLYLLKVNY